MTEAGDYWRMGRGFFDEWSERKGAVKGEEATGLGDRMSRGGMKEK